VFGGLEEILRDLLGTVVPTRCTPIPLQREADKSVYSGTIQDDRLLENARFYLAVMSGVPEQKIVGELPLKAKISSKGQIERLIIQAMRGLPLAHLASPPAEIPVQPGRCYFEVRQEGDHWREIQESRSIAVYVPPEFTELRLELMAVKE
jgi:type VI secretion system protein ImpJ